MKIRDKERTKHKILTAVGSIICEHGISEVGVNLVSSTAGVNKVLIYRYFVNIENLIEQYSKWVLSRSEFLKPFPESNNDSTHEFLINLLLDTLQELRKNNEMRQLLKWELQSGKPILFKAYADLYNDILSKIRPSAGDKDFSALVILFSSSICYLAIMKDNHTSVMDMNLESELEWTRIENIIRISITNYAAS